MDILWISAFYHDSAACLVRDGEIVGSEDRQSHPLVIPCCRDCEVDDLRTV
jgi:hypothetical protein